MPSCRSCQAPLFFATLIRKDGTRSPKKHPFDYIEDPDGKYRLDGPKGGASTIARWAPTRPPGARPEGDDGLRYTSHFATCPYANDHRRQPGDRHLKQGARRA